MFCTSNWRYANCLFAFKRLLIGCLAVLSIGARIGLAQPKSASTSAVVIGCMDEQPGPQYVLRDPKDLRLVAALRPVGFKAEVFAKYLGQKV